MATKKKNVKKSGDKQAPKTVIHPVITFDCSSWSAGIPEEKITRGRFKYPSVVLATVSKRRSKRKP